VDMREMLAFAQQPGTAPGVEPMPMSQVSQAGFRVRQNQARYRVVPANNQPAGG